MRFRLTLKAMTLNAKIGVLWIFWQFWAARHISRANFAKITKDRPVQPVYEIFSIEHRFQRFKSLPRRFKEACACGHQIGVPPFKLVILPLWTSKHK